MGPFSVTRPDKLSMTPKIEFSKYSINNKYNVTGRHRGPVGERRHDIGVLCAISHILPIGRRLYQGYVTTHDVSSSSVVSRAFFAICARYACIRSSDIILIP